MANNCLVTKLKGVVNNDDLDILGKFKMKFLSFSESIYNSINIASNISEDETIDIVGLTYKDGTSKKKVVSRSDLPDGDFQLYLPKYDLIDIYMDTGNDLSNKITINLEDIALSQITRLVVPFNTVNGNLSVLTTEYLNDLNIYGNGGNVTGSISDFVNLSRRVFLKQTFSPVLIINGWRNNNITGKLKTAIDSIATFAQSGTQIRIFRLDGVDYSDFPNLNLGVNIWIDFDGQGSYSVHN